MIVTHIKESDFSEIKLDTDDDDYQIFLAEEIKKLVKSTLPILYTEEGYSLILAQDPLITSRLEQELGRGKYKIIIKPLIDKI